MDKAQKTADYFRDKSDEEIIDWMIKNLSTEQIRSCLGDDIPDVIKPVPKGQIDVTTLRQYCANKPYIIHKIEEETVYYWYYMFKSKKWTYNNSPISDFPTEMGALATECSPTEDLDDDEKNMLNEATSTLQLAMNIQKQLKVDTSMKLSSVFTYTPVLIESADSKQNIYYYYLWYEIKDENLFVSVKGKDRSDTADVETTTVNNCVDNFNAILEHWIKLNDKIILDGDAGASNTYTPSQIKTLIKDAITNKFIGKFKPDLLTIKANYESISKLDNTYFMPDLLPEETSFGKIKNYNTLEEYVGNFYGKSFMKLFKPKIVENKFGLKTLHYELR